MGARSARRHAAGPHRLHDAATRGAGTTTLITTKQDRGAARGNPGRPAARPYAIGESRDAQHSGPLGRLPGLRGRVLYQLIIDSIIGVFPQVNGVVTLRLWRSHCWLLNIRAPHCSTTLQGTPDHRAPSPTTMANHGGPECSSHPKELWGRTTAHRPPPRHLTSVIVLGRDRAPVAVVFSVRKEP